MSIQHALLTSLLEKPSSGYELANRFDHSIGYFWQATHQQIYRELGRMTAAGWLLAEHDPEETGRRKKTYHVLDAGRQELARWTAEAGGTGSSDQALLIKLRAEAVMGPLGAGRELRRLVERHQQQLQIYRDIEQRDFSSPAMSHAQKLQHAVLRMGIKTEENWLTWAEETLPLVE
ncbi:PadR family transcriptional regulator [Halopseudomonas bauzanensis]|uniref:PadR family transcriptional regulator n=1 Tax=Halopseudomonas bauzanensis TaxID=653930 RepID=UPI002556F9EB|nr:PadR family transcriptional regulator [Halopseudomonas bauzanensis]